MNYDLAMKTCFKCKIEKPIDEFYKHPQMGDGHLNKCKECTKRDVSVYRMKNPELVLARYRAKYKGEFRQRMLKSARDWGKSHQHLRSAHDKVQAAVRSGDLVRRPCEFCGCAVSVAHHEDYAKPLDVMWLCNPCHKSLHKRKRGMRAWRLEFLGVDFVGLPVPDSPL